MPLLTRYDAILWTEPVVEDNAASRRLNYFADILDSLVEAASDAASAMRTMAHNGRDDMEGNDQRHVIVQDVPRMIVALSKIKVRK